MRDGFLYMKVYHAIRQDMENGVYRKGDKLPNDKEFADKYGVSLITVKKALTMLKEEGIVQRVSGVGSFVEKMEPSRETPDLPRNEVPHKKIGLVIEHVSNSFGLDMIYHLDRLAEEKGYHLLIRFSYYNLEKEMEEIRFLIEEGVEGLIVMPCHGTFYNAELLKLILYGFPIVIVDKKMEGISVPSVRTDNCAAMETLVEKMGRMGCRSLGLVTTRESDTPSIKRRIEGFRRGTVKLGIQVKDTCVLEFDENIYSHAPKEKNVEQAMEYLRREWNATDGFAVVEYSLVSALVEAGKRLGYNLLLEKTVCCIDGEMSSGIIHMRQDEKQIAERAIDILARRMDGEETVEDVKVQAILTE